jgi:hypothetical protein
MIERIEEARDILGAIVLGDSYKHWPIGLVRAHHLLELFLAEWQEFEEDDVVILAPADSDNEVIALTAEPPFPDSAA